MIGVQWVLEGSEAFDRDTPPPPKANPRVNTKISEEEVVGWAVIGYVWWDCGLPRGDLNEFSFAFLCDVGLRPDFWDRC